MVVVVVVVRVQGQSELPSELKVRSSQKNKTKMVVHAVMALGRQGLSKTGSSVHAQLHNEFEARLGYMRVHL